MRELHLALTRCATYPDAPRQVEFRETHISRLYLTDNLVYKIKKPVDFGFCDFTSLSRRRHFCQEEVRLNRRLAPDCYLGVSRIVRRDGEIHIDQEGEICEYAVRMRRLPAKAMLPCLLDQPEAQTRLEVEIPRIGRLLADFHRSAESIPSSRHDDARALESFWAQNFTQTREARGKLIATGVYDRLEERVRTFLREENALLRERQSLGLVRDGHRDLHCEHICLTTPVRIFDCIEFNPDLRYGDILSDFAFLWMDLRYRGHALRARQLWESYRRALDPGPEAERLLRAYALYRAWVRAKVHLLQAGLAETEARDHRRQVRNYLHLAAGFALPPLLLVCCGLIGSGKSTLASDLGRGLGLAPLSSDRLRPEVMSQASAEHDRYNPASRLAVYAVLAKQATGLLRQGEAVLIDASCENPEMRVLLMEAARKARAQIHFIETACPDALIRERLRERAAGTAVAHGSEAGIAEYEAQLSRFVPLFEACGKIPVDTGLPRKFNVDFVLERLLQSCGKI